jgi:Type II secretion system (T2SS), protein K
MKAPLILLTLLAFRTLIATADTPGVFFMEPADSSKGKLPVYRLITDENRLNTYVQWIQNDAAKWALDLYGRAWKIAKAQSTHQPAYFIALVPGGNHADVGFTLLKDAGEESFPNSTYIKLDPDPATFKTTLLHETGHMVLALLNAGEKIPQQGIASIPHTTAALTDRGTAFDEGFAIHLETLAAHFLTDPEIQSRYNHQSFQFGVPLMLGEYHRIAGDLLSYSQTATRYIEVRENNFAFAPAFKGPDYFRTQLEKSRDFAELRDADQLLQSEGFHASFFFSQLVRGVHPTFDDTVMGRQNRTLEVLADVFAEESSSGDSPYLLRFIEHYLKKFPDEGKEVLDVFLDLSHGVFLDRNAARLWHDHYLAALRLDLAEKKNDAIESARQNWRTKVLADPKILYSLLGPQIPVEVADTSILLVAFEEAAPLAFDINTAEEGVLRCVPGITDREIGTWLAQRRSKPFEDAADFKARAGVSAALLSRFKFPDQGK